MAVRRLGWTRAIVSAAAVTATASLLFASAPRQDPLTRICAQLRGLSRDDNGVRRSAAETGPSWWIRQTCSKVQ